MRIAFLAIDKNSAKIARAVRRWACPVPCTVRTYKETVPGLAKDLQEGIPPSDRLEAGSAQFVPSRFSDILNSAWITYMFSPQRLERLLDSKPRDKRRFAVKTLNDLVLKAIEASEIFGRCHGLPMEK